jgi:hypothetical protein
MSKTPIDTIKDFGSPYFKDNLFQEVKEEVVVEYNPDHLQIARCIDDGSIYTLNLKDGIKVLVLGYSGSGKSMAIRGVLDRLKIVGKDIAILTDVKNEFGSSLFPVQWKFRNGLLPGEEAQGMKIVPFRPTFFKKINPELPHRNVWLSFDARDLSENDFGNLMNISKISNINQKIALEEIYKEMRKEYKRNPDFEFSQSWLEQCVDSLDIAGQSKTSVKFKFRPLFDSKMFMEKYRRDFVGLMKQGIVPTINMEGFNLFSKGSSLNFPLATLSMLHSSLIEARKNGELQPLWFVLEEMTRFVNNKDDSSFKKDVIESYGLNRRYNINYISVVQLIEDVPVEILKQSDYIMIPSSADTNTIRQVLMTSGMAKNQQTATNESMELKRRMKRHKWSWIAVCRKDGSRELIKFLSPLSKHKLVEN